MQVYPFSSPNTQKKTVFETDFSDGVYAEGGVIDARNVIFDISQSVENFRFSDINYFLRLNHSRLITSRLKWRPELYSELEASTPQLHAFLSIYVHMARVKCDPYSKYIHISSLLPTDVRPNAVQEVEDVRRCER